MGIVRIKLENGSLRTTDRDGKVAVYQRHEHGPFASEHRPLNTGL
jgi:hypothetical protein